MLYRCAELSKRVHPTNLESGICRRYTTFDVLVYVVQINSNTLNDGKLKMWGIQPEEQNCSYIMMPCSGIFEMMFRYVGRLEWYVVMRQVI